MRSTLAKQANKRATTTLDAQATHETCSVSEIHRLPLEADANGEGLSPAPEVSTRRICHCLALSRRGPNGMRRGRRPCRRYRPSAVAGRFLDATTVHLGAQLSGPRPDLRPSAFRFPVGATKIAIPCPRSNIIPGTAARCVCRSDASRDSATPVKGRCRSTRSCNTACGNRSAAQSAPH